MPRKTTFFYSKKTFNLGGELRLTEAPLVMGILNTTPDSFFRPKSGHLLEGGSLYLRSLLEKGGQMLQDGADILDIGGMSSRPGARIIDIEEEKERVIPAIRALKKEYPSCLISIDTVHAEVAAAACGEGAAIINDISAGRIDPQIIETAARLRCPYILMHMKGIPETMQKKAEYENVFEEVLDFFIREIPTLIEKGIKDIIIDPGFGFGKTIDHNYLLLNRLQDFSILGHPLLAGISRKSMIWKVLGESPEEAMAGTIGLNTIALLKGADILRVHDVKEAHQLIQIVDYFCKDGSRQNSASTPIA